MKKYIIGIDVGGTKIAAGLVDKNYQVSKVAVIPTSQTDLLGQLERLIADYSGFEAIGVGMPGQVLPSGLVLKLTNIPKFKQLNLKRFLENKFNTPVSVINDAKAFALAEAHVGSGKNSKAVAGLIIGTGMGAGFVMGKKLYSGKDGLAGELEHITLLDGKMLHIHRKLAGKFTKVSQFKKFLKTMLSLVILSFNPDIVVLGGGLTFLPGLEKQARQFAVSVGEYQNRTKVVVSKLKNAGIIGAALPLLKK